MRGIARSPHYSLSCPLLPPKLSAKHHFLFTFFEVPVSTKKKKQTLGDKEATAAGSVAVVVGYAIVPLYEGGRIVVHTSEHSHSVPVVSRLEPTDFTDTVMLGQAQRGICELRFKHPGLFMFHAHKTEFAELGWMGFFEVA